MFRVVFLDRLDREDSRDAILKPLADKQRSVRLHAKHVDRIIELSGGYPYFIQFICREVYDVLLQKTGSAKNATLPETAILRKLDSDFFAGRWARATDRQRQLLAMISNLEHCEGEFTVQDIVEQSKAIEEKPFSSSHVNQILVKLSEIGLVYKNRHGKYSFAVPLLGEFIRRQRDSVGTAH
jgi:hypothetical protein